MNQIIQTNQPPNYQQPVVWTALVTPLLSCGAIDFVSLTRLANRQSDAQNGILLLGSTGEGIALTSEEQLAIVKHVTALTLNVPIMVAVGGYNLAAQLSWIEQCNSLAVDAYLLGSPVYAKPGPVGQTAWFQALLDAANLPCMLYNVPSRSGVEIAMSALQTLQYHQNCWALKEASGDLQTLLSYRQHCPELELYSGEDAMMPYLANAGVKGLVSVCANVWPEATQRYTASALAQTCTDVFPLWHNAIAALFQVTSPIPVKALMAEVGMIDSATLRLPLCADELLANHGLQSFHQQIQQWLLTTDCSSTSLSSTTILREVNQ